MALDQIVNSTHPGQLTRQHLVREAKRRETQAVLRKMGRMTVETLASIGQPLTDREVAIYKNAQYERAVTRCWEAKTLRDDLGARILGLKRKALHYAGNELIQRNRARQITHKTNIVNHL